jgi:hypothetical protein
MDRGSPNIIKEDDQNEPGRMGKIFLYKETG